MRRDGPTQGILIAADPATVERSGFAIRFRPGTTDHAAWCGWRLPKGKAGKATEAAMRATGVGRLLIYESSTSSTSSRPSKAGFLFWEGEADPFSGLLPCVTP